jgi:hypothetical protein
MNLTQAGSTKARRGKLPKSIWTTAASWFSNPPDRQKFTRQETKKPLQKKSWQSGLGNCARDK